VTHEGDINEDIQDVIHEGDINQDVQDVIHEGDINKDGVLDFEEWRSKMKK